MQESQQLKNIKKPLHTTGQFHARKKCNSEYNEYATNDREMQGLQQACSDVLHELRQISL